MSLLRKTMLFTVVGLLIMAFAAKNANAAGGSGGHSMEFGLGLLTAGQDDMNTLIKTARVSATAANTSDMGSAYELFAQYQYRFSGTMFSIAFRPSYITQSTTGSGTDGDYNYKLSGFTLFPMFRLYPLENNFIKLYIQTGLGYGRMTGEVTEGAASISFAGSAFGAIGGLGVDFCFTPAHCLSVEGNLRYLPIERNLASSATGSAAGLSQTTVGQEVEIGGGDLKTTMSGIQGSLAYTLNF